MAQLGVLFRLQVSLQARNLPLRLLIPAFLVLVYGAACHLHGHGSADARQFAAWQVKFLGPGSHMLPWG